MQDTLKAKMVRAMAESVAPDGEGGQFPALFDLLDFSGENKTRLVLTAALDAALKAAADEGLVLMQTVHR